MTSNKLKAEILHTQVGYKGFFQLQCLTVEHDRFDGGSIGPVEREVLHRSDVVAALLYDPRHDKVVLVEQYRAGAHVAGVSPWLIDIVAGRIENGQTPAEAIRREIVEESGLKPDTLEPIGTYLTAPHLSSEQIHLYIATVDATSVGGYHGLAHEGEDIRPLVLDRTEALALPRHQAVSLWSALALAWLANRPFDPSVEERPG